MDQVAFMQDFIHENGRNEHLKALSQAMYKMLHTPFLVRTVRSIDIKGIKEH